MNLNSSIMLTLSMQSGSSLVWFSNQNRIASKPKICGCLNISCPRRRILVVCSRCMHLVGSSACIDHNLCSSKCVRKKCFINVSRKMLRRRCVSHVSPTIIGLILVR